MAASPLSRAISTAEAVHRIQFSLIESPSCFAGHLLAAGSLLSHPDYKDIVVERSITGLCGYPPCPNSLPVNRDRHGRFRVSLREHRVYDLGETYNYCSEACVISSRAFSESLNADRVSEMSKSKIEQLLRLFENLKVGGEDLGEERDLGIIKSFSIKEKEDAGAGEVSLDEWIGPANAIEGYVPQRDRIGHSGSNFMPQQHSRKQMEGAGDSGAPFASSLSVGNETGGIRSKESSDVKQDVSEMIVKMMEKTSIAEDETNPKKTTEKASKIKLKKNSDDYESNNMDFTSSIIVGNEFDDWNASSLAGQDISEVIAKQLENVVLEEKKTRKNTGISQPSRFKHHRKLKGVTDENVYYTSSLLVRDEVDTVNVMGSFNPKKSSEAIARRLEDSIVVEKKPSNKPSKLSKPKTKKMRNGNNSGKQFMNGFASIRDRDDAVASNQYASAQVLPKEMNGGLMDVCFGKEPDKTVVNISNYEVSSEKVTSSNEAPVKELEDKISSEKKTTSEEKLKKSCLKTSGSRVRDHSVKWADEKKNASLEDKKIIPQESFEEDFDSSIRFTSAEVCAAALTQAAESVTSGNAEVEDAVSEAGILILPTSLQGEREDDDDIFKFDRGIVKWPTKNVLLDTDMFDVQDSWHDTPPEGFSLNVRFNAMACHVVSLLNSVLHIVTWYSVFQLSPFANMWMALFGWINCSTLDYIYGHDECSYQNFMLVNGKEYPRKVTLRDGQSLEIRQALDGFICRILPVLAKDQRLPVPVSTLEKFMGCLLDTMSFMDAIPSFKIRQWHVLVLLFIEALSVHRLPVLAPHLMSRGIQLQQVLNAAQISNEEYETMKDLVLPLGRSTEFSVQ